LVVKELARTHKNVSFIGDLDQTIYSWRGSQPFFLKKLIQSHFPDMKEMGLVMNYRFNPNVLSAVKSFLGSFVKPETKELKTLKENDSTEKAVNVFAGHNFNEEIFYVIEKIKQLKKSDPDSRAVVIARANYLIGKTAEIFAGQGVAHITVDKYEFFRRQEVKDVYAYLKIIFNRFDLESAYRLVKRPPRNIGAVTMKNIIEQGASGIKVSDFLNFKNYKYPEPFFDLINRFDKGRVVVLDTETTGTNIFSDDIVQVFAAEVVKGKVGERFHFYLKNDVSVGFSQTIHGLSDDFLKKEGHNPKKVLADLKKFIAGDAVIGHNVNFDLGMILENGKRRGVAFEFKEYYDTLDLSKRLVQSPNYRLSTLAELLGLASATHDARDDVDATIGLLSFLIERLRKDQPARVAAWQEHSGKFLKLAAMIDSWQKIVSDLRPAAVLDKVWEESGLEDYYQEDEEADKRAKSILELRSVFEEKDDKAKRPEVSLRELIHYAALVKDINFLGLEKGKVPIVTAHQVKGLEFDYVFIIGMNEYVFPNAKSDLEEEKRLFYVAMTRAKKRIYITYSKFKDQGYLATKSRFIDYIDEKHVNFES
jgi:DNA helicase-2/ATP-dependent DNA helicase PcrA